MLFIIEYCGPFQRQTKRGEVTKTRRSDVREQKERTSLISGYPHFTRLMKKKCRK